MKNTLLIRNPDTLKGHQIYLEKQAILAIVRSFLAGNNQKRIGDVHSLLVPAHLDILPLMALVAEDFAEFVEPEPDKEPKPMPLIIYYDQFSRPGKNKALYDKFLHGRWFSLIGQISLREIHSQYRPDTCIHLGRSTEYLREIFNGEYSFRNVVGFSAFMGEENINQDRESFQLSMADNIFRRDILRTLDQLKMSEEEMDQLRGWISLPDNLNQEERLEPFIPFGLSTERVMFLEG